MEDSQLLLGGQTALTQMGWEVLTIMADHRRESPSMILVRVFN